MHHGGSRSACGLAYLLHAQGPGGVAATLETSRVGQRRQGAPREHYNDTDLNFVFNSTRSITAHLHLAYRCAPREASSR